MPVKVMAVSTIIGIVLVFSTNISHALLLFFLAGIVPGTNIILSPGTMLLLLSVAGILATLAIVTAKTSHAKTIRSTIDATLSSKHLPTRRFSDL